MAVGLSRRICQRWVARYNEEGPTGLDARRGRESQLPISPEERAALRERIEAGPLVVPDNITLVKLPHYSPELNPIENHWHYLKSHSWSNRAYADYNALEVAAMTACRKAVLDEDLVKSVCAAPDIDRVTSS